MKINNLVAPILLSLLNEVHGLWQPAAGTTWQIVLSEKLKNISMGVEAYDLDLFINPKSTITSLHNKNLKAICYFSAGTWEKWRKDAGEFKKSDLGKPLADWPGERWLNVTSENVRKIMEQRMDIAVKKGCDAVDPDNIDAYGNGGGGFNLTKQDAIDYVKFLSRESHKRGLAMSLKNGGGLIPHVLSDVEFSVNEQCVQYHECETFRPFITAGKPVFHIEYVKKQPPTSKVDKICSTKPSRGFSTLIKHLNLDQWVVFCPEDNVSSPNKKPASHSKKKTGSSSNPKGNGATSNLVRSSAIYLIAALGIPLFQM